MKKETAQQIFNRKVNDNLMDVIFVKPQEVAITPKKQLLNHQSSLGIKVQSVSLPKEHQLFAIKSEVEVLDWLQNKVKSVHTANYILRLKYEQGQIIKLKYAELLSRN